MGKMFISSQEFADALEMNKSSVSYLINKGEIKAFKVSNKWKIPAKEVERFIESRLSATENSNRHECNDNSAVAENYKTQEKDDKAPALFDKTEFAHDKQKNSASRKGYEKSVHVYMANDYFDYLCEMADETGLKVAQYIRLLIEVDIERHQIMRKWGAL